MAWQSTICASVCWADTRTAQGTDRHGPYPPGYDPPSRNHVFPRPGHCGTGPWQQESLHTFISKQPDLKNWENLKVRVKAADSLRNLTQVSRDNARTPMQWDDTAHVGFTTAARSWFAVNPNYRQVNVRSESVDPTSVLSFYRAMIRLCWRWRCLSDGWCEDISTPGTQVYAYTRRAGGKAAVVVQDFSDMDASFTLPVGHAADVKGNAETQTNLLKVFLMEKAAYEIRYDAANRALHGLPF
ncbi:alpha-amylase family glycosyl hydrolase [Komagataeibacter medellinensis]|uniref:alpha-amylase family glycosyl hydrolase n=1 Tax=Komagataeibacter medellinensis TaxID=1177712 RepID=UPI001E29CB31|nr:hypothetical protein [Komagataeibacter medellinensis]